MKVDFLRARMHTGKNNKFSSGQSTIEFILTFTGAIGFIFLFLKMSLNYTNGYMAHHAVFMASRAYLVSDDDTLSNTSANNDSVLDVFKYYHGSYFTPKSGGLQVQYGGTFPIFTGVWIEFSQLFSTSFIGGKTEIKFRSESFLGREPNRDDSVTQTCDAIKSVAFGNCTVHATLDDNGG